MTRRPRANIHTLPTAVRRHARLRFAFYADNTAARPAADDYDRQRRRDCYVLTFGALLIASLLLTGWYGSGAGRPVRGLLNAALAVGWAFFYGWEPLRRLPVVGPLLGVGARLAATMAVTLLFGFLYYQLLIA